MSWLLTLIVLYFTINYHPSDARSTRNNKLPTAVVVGTVYCDTCFHNDLSETSHFISGALVAVECDDTISKSKPSFRKEVQTNKHGEFKVELPFSIGKHVNKIKGCSVKIISSSEPYCAVASTATSSALHLKSRKPGTHIFSAGFFTFKPLTQPNLCNQKPSILNSKKLINSPNFDPTFPPPLQDPPASIIPPIDNPGQFAPLPILPRLPPLPQLPDLPILPPGPKNDEFSNEKAFGFPPNPFQPPLIPNPLQPPPSIFPPIFPTPPPSIFPPIFPTPPPSIFPPIFPTPPPPPSVFPPIIPAPSPPPSFPPVPFLPPIPFFTPPPSPPPPSSFPPIPFLPPIPFFTPPPPPPSPPPPSFPLIPPFPFQPSPGFPGIPPAASASISKGSSP